MEKPLSKSQALASQVMFATLCLLRDKGCAIKVGELLEAVEKQLPLDDWAREVIESNGLPRWRMYAHFFSVDAVKAGFLTKAQGRWSLTAAGTQALQLGARGYFLKAQQGYKAWKAAQLADAGAAQIPLDPVLPVDAEAEVTPPEVRLELLKREVDSALAAEILERIKSNSWQFFERLVVDLLLAMGYGGAGGQGFAFQRAGDEGVDGFISQDKLGLEVVYVQAKRWKEQAVGRPDIQQFVGALAGRQAQRGVFITTSRFSTEARNYVKPLNVRVVLVDGEHLAQLMIEHGVGVSLRQRYDFKRIDSDFFSEDGT